MAMECAVARITSTCISLTSTPISIGHPVVGCASLGVAHREGGGGGGVRAKGGVRQGFIGLAQAEHIPVLDANHGSTTIALGSAGQKGRASLPFVGFTRLGIAACLGGREEGGVAEGRDRWRVHHVEACIGASLSASSTSHRALCPVGAIPVITRADLCVTILCRQGL